MATNLTRLNVALTMSVGAFVSASRSATSAVKSLGEGIKSPLLSPLTAVAGLLSTGAIVAGLKSSADRIDALAKSADRLGISTEAFAGLTHAAELSGASAEAMVSGMEKLTKKIQEAASGSAEAKKSLDALGLSAYQLSTLRADEQFAKVSDALNEMGSAGERTAAAMDLFGKGGGALLNVTALGSAGLKDMAADAEALGLATTRANAAQVEAANDAMSRAGESIKGLFDTAMVAMAPFVKAAADGFVDLVKRVRDWGFSVESVGNFIKHAFAFIADAWQVVMIGFKYGKVAVASIGQSFWAVADEGARAFSIIGQFVWNWNRATWETAKAVGEVFAVLWNGVKWAALKSFSLIGEKFADLLFLMSDGARAAGLDIAGELTTAAHAVGRSAAAASAKASADIGQSMNDLVNQAANAKDAWKNLFVIDTGYVDSIHRVRETASNFAEQSRGELREAINAPWNSALVYQWGDAVQANAQKAGKAVADAKAIANAPATPIIDTSAMDKALSGMLAENDPEFAEIAKHEQKLQKMAELTQYYDDIGQSRSAELAAAAEAEEQRHQNAMVDIQLQRYQRLTGGASSFFANLSSLQNTHSKAARAAGKIAAKGKIVMDTASAAMGAYSAMASIPFIGPALGIAAAAAAVVAGSVQLANVDKSDSGSIGGSAAPDVSTSNIGGISAPAQTGQTLLLQGDSFSAESLVRLFDEARERGITIGGVRRA
jgi:hypothetical protein